MTVVTPKRCPLSSFQRNDEGRILILGIDLPGHGSSQGDVGNERPGARCAGPDLDEHGIQGTFFP